MRARQVAAAPAPLVLVGVALALLLVGTACSAGQITETSRQVSGVSGASGQAGDIVVRDAQITFPAVARGDAAYLPGSTAPLSMTVVNQGSAPDRLISGSSANASTVTITGDASLPAGQALVAGQRGDVTLPETKRIDLALSGVRVPLKAGGLRYEVVLFFERAGTLRLELPVGNPDGSAG